MVICYNEPSRWLLNQDSKFQTDGQSNLFPVYLPHYRNLCWLVGGLFSIGNSYSTGSIEPLCL